MLMPDCRIKSDANMKKSERGAFQGMKTEVDNNKLFTTKWFDNQVVTLFSTFAGAYPQDTVTRFCKKENSRITVKRPICIKVYNRFMGGIDSMDQYIAFH